MRRPADGRDHDPQLRGGRRPPRDARPHAPARARRRRVAPVQEPAGQAHPGGAAAGRDRRARRPAPGPDRHAGAQPRRGAHQPAARHRAPGGLRLGRALRPPVPRPALRGAPALAPAPALLRAAAEVRGAAPAARPSARSSCPSRSTTSASTGWPSTTSSPGCASSRWTCASSTRRSPRRCAPSAWRSSARCSASPPAASSTPRWPGSTTSWPRASRSSSSPATSRSRRRSWSASRDALHLLGRDKIADRDESVRAFQDPDGPQLIVCATRVAAQGITLTRASNVAFLELEWTPAMHDQAEDRCHRIGQRDAVTAWYLLAADTIDETMARLIQRKRGLDRRRHRRAHLDGDGHGRRRRARAARRQALPPPAQRRLTLLRSR